MGRDVYPFKIERQMDREVDQQFETKSYQFTIMWKKSAQIKSLHFENLFGIFARENADYQINKTVAF